jgi:hypothetical protein
MPHPRDEQGRVIAAGIFLVFWNISGSIVLKLVD